MSLNYIFEILVHFHTYKNIELLNQGIYKIQLKIFTTLNNKKYYAIPYFYTNSKALENLDQTDEKSNKNPFIISSEISENNYEYNTKSYFIKYADEEVELDEFCYFRIEIPSSFTKNDLELTCQFDLGFSDSFTSAQKNNKELSKCNIKFKSVQSEYIQITNQSSENFNINNINNLNNNDNFSETYTPVVYHSNFSSLLRVSIHKILIDYKIRVDTNELPFLLEDPETNTNDKKTAKDDDKITQIPPVALINFLSQEKDIVNELSNDTINKLYKKYVVRLINSYIGVKNRMTFLTTKLIEENMKAEFSMFLNIQPLIIYSEEGDGKIISLHSEEDLGDIMRSIQNLSERISDHSKDYVGYRIFKEINIISSQVLYLWHKYIELIRYFPAPVNFIMKLDFRKQLKDDLFKFLKKSTVQIPDSSSLVYPAEENMQSINNNLAEEMRQNLKDNYIKPKFENSNYKITPEIFPILFEETYTKNMNHNIETNKIVDNIRSNINNSNNTNDNLNRNSNNAINNNNN